MILLPIKGLNSIGNNLNVFQLNASPLNFSFQPDVDPCKIVITNTGQAIILITFSNYMQSVISYVDRQCFVLESSISTYQPHTDIKCTLLAYNGGQVLPYIWIEQYRMDEPIINRYHNPGGLV